MHRVTVVGAGFGALTAIRTLRGMDKNIHIDVVAPKPEFVYFPGTIWIPTGLRRPEDLVVPLDNYFRRMKVTYHQAEATGLSENTIVIFTSDHDDQIVRLKSIRAGGAAFFTKPIDVERFMRSLSDIEHKLHYTNGQDQYRS